MRLRHFTDREGVAWRAWEIRLERPLAEPWTADGPLKAPCLDGWLLFETLSGDRRRSLSPIPAGWETLPGPEFSELLQQATPRILRHSRRRSPPRAPAQTSSVASARATDALDDAFGSGPLRAFVYPGGQAWTVRVVQPQRSGPRVLRFTSGARSLDLTVWPDDWTILSSQDLVALLRTMPRTGLPSEPGTPRRRWNDPPPLRP
jgi:hypothetical protein